MQLYRCYFISSGKSITSVEIIECTNDAAVRQAGVRLLLKHTPYAIEVWDRARRVFCAHYSGLEDGMRDGRLIILPAC
jgi:hypothetical protein